MVAEQLEQASDFACLFTIQLLVHLGDVQYIAVSLFFLLQARRWGGGG